ncbi:MAG: hypothetical protein RLZZ611_692 [Cyanobacteriota bacterium]|jgi:ArsR family transcriptional regulator
MPAAALPTASVPAASPSPPADPAGGVAATGVEPLAFQRAQLLLRALADPIRLRVMESLGEGERCVCDLTTELELPQPKLSFHLKVMKEAGLITARQQGRWMYYKLQPTALLRLRDWLDQLADGCATPAQPCA